MSDKLRESISALVDGEANEMDLHRVLKATSEDDAQRQTWQRYQTISSVLKKDEFSTLQIDISQRVKDEIAGSKITGSQRFAQLFKPMASMAVAATVTVAVLTGTQVYQVAQGGNGAIQVAGSENFSTSAPVAAGQFSNLALPASASSDVYRKPTQAQRDERAYADAIAEQRLEQYMQQHVEKSTLNTGNGVMPFARVQSTEGR